MGAAMHRRRKSRRCIGPAPPVIPHIDRGRARILPIFQTPDDTEQVAAVCGLKIQQVDMGKMTSDSARIFSPELLVYFP